MENFSLKAKQIDYFTNKFDNSSAANFFETKYY